MEGKHTSPGAVETQVAQPEGAELVLTGRAARPARPAVNAAERLIEHAPVGIQEIDAEGRYLRVNRAFCRLTGYLPGELLGRSMSGIAASPEYVERLRDLLYAGEGMARFEMPYLRSDGSLLQGMVTASVIPAEGNRPASLLAVVEDLAGHLPDGEDPGAAVETRVDAVEIVAAAVARARELAEAKGVAVAFCYPNQPLWVRADAAEIADELELLLLNAVRSVSSGALAVRCTPADGAAVVELIEAPEADSVGADLATLFAPDDEAPVTAAEASRITLRLPLARR